MPTLYAVAFGAFLAASFALTYMTPGWVQVPDREPNLRPVAFASTQDERDRVYEPFRGMWKSSICTYRVWARPEKILMPSGLGHHKKDYPPVAASRSDLELIEFGMGQNAHRNFVNMADNGQLL